MDLVNRLKFFMDSNKIAISQFADTCGIPRPTMSQILNGRNKKISDELISKIHAAYPNLSVLWLMFGEGEMAIGTNTSFSEAENSRNCNNTDAQTADNQLDNLFASHDTTTPEKPSEKIGQPHQTINPSLTINTAQYSTDSTSKAPFPGNAPSIAASIDESYGIIDFENGDTNNATTIPLPPDTASSYPGSASLNNPAKAEMADTPNEPQHLQAESPSTAPAPSISLKTEPGKHITNIVVFYSDNSFQSFYPDYPSPSPN